MSSGWWEIKISVITPTYQRAATLPRLRDSLLAQGVLDMEWVVVDDGSTDGTEKLVRLWQRDDSFPITYFRQPNQGKEIALNRGVEAATGEFCAVMDSDDWYAPGALVRMLEGWNSIPVERRCEFANIEGLCADPNGEVIGDRFPASPFDSNAFEVGAVHGVTGDKIGMYRREILLAFPFPEDLGWHVPPALIWNRIASRYSTRYENQVWAYKEYLGDGLSTQETELRLRYSSAQLIYWREFAGMPRAMPWRARLRGHANYVRYSLLEQVPLRRQLELSPNRRWTIAAWPIGLLLSLRDRRAARAHSISGGST